MKSQTAKALDALRRALEPGWTSFIGTDIHNAAVTLFRHLTLLGPNPAGWTTHPLG